MRRAWFLAPLLLAALASGVLAAEDADAPPPYRLEMGLTGDWTARNPRARAEVGPEGGTVLLARAAVARDVLPDGLAGLGWQVDVVEAYRTLAAVPDDAQRRRIASADMATFTSSSTVERFVELYGLDAVPPVVVCIGPVTAATARRLGVRVDVEATEHTIAGLVEAASNAPRFSS